MLCSFDGSIINYDIKNKKISSQNSIKKIIKAEKIQNFVANPPYIHKILYNENISPGNIYLALLNGSIVSIKNNTKKNYTKSVHKCNILDMKFFKNDTLLTLGKDSKIKFLDINNKLETKFYIELDQPATFIETWDSSSLGIEDSFSNLTLDSGIKDKIGFNYSNEIYYIDSDSKKLKKIILK